MPELGTIYLLHFVTPYKHARHYLGWAKDANKRIALHRRGQSGAKLTEAATNAGIEFLVGWQRPGTRDEERRVHRGRQLARDCPICRAERVVREAVEIASDFLAIRGLA